MKVLLSSVRLLQYLLQQHLYLHKVKNPNASNQLVQKKYVLGVMQQIKLITRAACEAEINAEAENKDPAVIAENGHQLRGSGHEYETYVAKLGKPVSRAEAS